MKMTFRYQTVGDIRQTQRAIIGVILELSEREKFCNNFRISGRSSGPNFGFPYTFYIFSLLPQGEGSQLRETFSPKSSSRRTPAAMKYRSHNPNMIVIH